MGMQKLFSFFISFSSSVRCLKLLEMVMIISLNENVQIKRSGINLYPSNLEEK